LVTSGVNYFRSGTFGDAASVDQVDHQRERTEKFFVHFSSSFVILVWAFDGAVLNENEISSIPADYAQRHVQANTKQ
jgi:hypothetical protein